MGQRHSIGADAFCEAIEAALRRGLAADQAQALGQAACDQAMSTYRDRVRRLTGSQLRLWLDAYEEFGDKPVAKRIVMADYVIEIDTTLGEAGL